MYSFTALTCPNCSGKLSIETDREFCFCQHCGTRILLQDENLKTTRYIDEARVKRAETDQMVKLREIEHQERCFKWKVRRFLTWFGVATLLIVTGTIALFIGDATEGEKTLILAGVAMIVWGVLPLIGSMNSSKKDH